MSGASDVYAHRRGLMLGLTLAELLMLVLFILLMTYTVILVESENEVERKDETIAKLEAANLELDGQVSVGISELVASLDIPSLSNADVDSLNLRLREVLEDVSLIAAENEKLSRLVTSPEEAVRLAEALQELDDAPSAPEILQDWISVRRAKESDSDLSAELDESSLPETLSDALIELSRLKEQVEYYKADKKKAGNGLTYPSCWYRDKKPVYIYDAAILDEGIELMVTDERAGLDLSAINLNAPGPLLNETLSLSQFKTSTAKLYSWSLEKDCRFYIRVTDKMVSKDKDVYVSSRKMLESHFYLYLRGSR